MAKAKYKETTNQRNNLELAKTESNENAFNVSTSRFKNIYHESYASTVTFVMILNKDK